MFHTPFAIPGVAQIGSSMDFAPDILASASLFPNILFSV